MSIEYGDIIKGAYQLLGRPSQLDLPYQDVMDHARDVIRGRLLDLKMAARGHTNVVGPWVTPTGRDMAVTAADPTGNRLVPVGTGYFIPVKMEWRTVNDAQEVPPRKAEIVSYDQLGDLFRSAMTFSETYVAFTDNFSKITFSETYETLKQRQYRLIYENLSDATADVELDSAVGVLPDLFITLCKYETAIMCLDHVVNESNEWMEKRERLRRALLGRYAMEEKRFEKWNTTLFGNKKVKRFGFRTRTR